MSQPPSTVTTEKTETILFQVLVGDKVYVEFDVTHYPLDSRHRQAAHIIRLAEESGGTARYVSTTVTTRTKTQELT